MELAPAAKADDKADEPAKEAPKAGRRGKSGGFGLGFGLGGGSKDKSADAAAVGRDGAPRQMGWGTEISNKPMQPPPARAGRRAGGRQPEADGGGGGGFRSRNRHFDNDDDAVMDIPDLEEAVADDDEEEKFNRQVAAPGKARNTTIQTLKELDQEVQHALPTGNDEIDLSLLITSLLPMEKVQEGEEAWDPEQLLHSVAFEMQAEKDLLAEEEEQVAADK